MTDKPPRELKINTKASDWVRQKLAAERAESESEQDAIKQVALRIPVEHIALVGAIAKRFKVSRNQMLCMLIKSAASDVYAELPVEDRKGLLDAVSDELGQPVRPHWLRDPPEDPELRSVMGDEQYEDLQYRARFEP